jgi:hypothetical protein
MRSTILAVAGGIVWAVALVVSDVVCPVHSQTFVTQPKQDLLVDMYVRTRKCMRSAGTAAHERGNDASHTQYFMVSVCSTAMLSFLRRDMPEDEAQSFMLRMTRNSYYEDVLHTQEPSPR